MTDIIELNGLSKRYGRRRGIEGLTFSVTEGEIFGFVGPRGAGKTTTTRLMLDLLRPTAGTVRIFGKDSHRQGAAIRKEIGYLPSEIYYYEHMRVKDVLDYAAGFYSARNSKKRIRELADYFELDLHLQVDELSRSSRKKTAIIQALLHSPKLLILDDPTAGLDQEMQYRLSELLRASQESGTTIFLASPVLGLTQRLCQRIALVREGQILDTVPVEALRKNTYQKVRAAADVQVQKLDLPGVNDFFSTANHLEFLYRGNTKQLLHALSQLPLHNVYIEEPDLDDIFYYYYGEDGPKQDFWRDQTEREQDRPPIIPLKQQQRNQQAEAPTTPQRPPEQMATPTQPKPSVADKPVYKPQAAPAPQPSIPAPTAATETAKAPPATASNIAPPPKAKEQPTLATPSQAAAASDQLPSSPAQTELPQAAQPSAQSVTPAPPPANNPTAADPAKQEASASVATKEETAQSAKTPVTDAEHPETAPQPPDTAPHPASETAEDDGFVDRILEEQRQKREAARQTADTAAVADDAKPQKPQASSKKRRTSSKSSAEKDGDVS